jgi:hypothetical protein
MKKQNYMATLEPELQLVLLLSRTKPNPGSRERIAGLLQTGLDWGRFVELARHHRLYPLIYPAFTQMDDPRIPPEVLPKLRKDCQTNQFRQLQLAGELIRLAGLIAAEGFTMIPLKGPVLAQRLFGNVGLRVSRDLDLLVKREEFDGVEQLLLKDGYQVIEHPGADLAHMDKRMHHYAYRHRQTGIMVELHYQMSFSELDLNCAEIIGRAQADKFNQAPLYRLAPEDELLFLIMHGARHGWARLRWLADIAEILERTDYCDWEALIRLARRYKFEYILGQAVCLAGRLFEIPINHAGLSALAHQVKSRRLAGLTMVFITVCPDEFFGGIGTPLYWKVKYYYFSLIGRPHLKLHFLFRNFCRMCYKQFLALRRAVCHE